MRTQTPLNHDLTLVDLLRICAKKKDLHHGMGLHDHILHKGLLQKCPYLASSIVCMYAECGDLEKAQQVLLDLPVRDVVSWSSLIAGYAEEGQGHQALECFAKMQREGLS